MKPSPLILFDSPIEISEAQDEGENPEWMARMAIEESFFRSTGRYNEGLVDRDESGFYWLDPFIPEVARYDLVGWTRDRSIGLYELRDTEALE